MVLSVARIAGAKLPTSFEVDDLFQVGTMGLMQAAERWDDTRGIPFNVYALRRVRGAMLDHVRGLEWREQNHDSLFSDPEGSKGDEREERAELPAQPSCESEVHERLDRDKRLVPVMKAIAQLEPVERLVLKGYYFNETSQKTIARKFDVTRCRISQIHTQSIRTLREDLAA